MPENDFEIPAHRLPPGFVDTLGEVPENPVEPRPAATVVLLREGAEGMEVLLLRRVRTAGFVPGAYVFPGGRVDGTDADAELLSRVSGLTEEAAAGRLQLFVGEPPAIAYYLAALREAFEETGILVGIDGRRQPLPSAEDDGLMARMQDMLLSERINFGEMLEMAHARLDGSAVEYIAHWVTPVAEARRYDTRFFAAEVPPETGFRLNLRELNDGLWLTPERALDRHRNGTLPMIFPTIKTLEALLDFETPFEALRHFRGQRIREILPELVRTENGVALRVE